MAAKRVLYVIKTCGKIKIKNRNSTFGTAIFVLSMQVNIFDGYAVYGIKDNTVSTAAANPEDDLSNLPNALIHYDIPGGSGI